MRDLQGLWQQEGQVWCYVAGGVVYVAQIVPHESMYEAFDLTEQASKDQAGPVRLGEYPSIEDAKAAVEKHFQEQNK